MSVTQQLMKLGSFSIQLVDDAPAGVLQAISRSDTVVITPNRLTPIEGYSDAAILEQAIYHGVITRQPSVDEISGHDVAWFLGTPEGAGYNVSGATTRTAGSLTQWIGDLTTPAFTAGTITNTTTHTATYQFTTHRERIDAVCRAMGAEWIAQPDLTIDAGPTANLFVTTPQVIITRREEGQEGDLRGLEGGAINWGADIDQYATKVTVVGKGAGATVAVTSATGSTTLKDPANNALVLERLVNAPTVAGTTASAVAAASLAQLNVERRDITVTSRTSLVRRFAKPGDYVWVFDQLAGVVDAASQVTFRGEVLAPMKLRVYGITWPIEATMGVYVRRAAATPTYTDISAYVQPERADVRWDVGASPRSESDTNPATTGSTAYLGANVGVTTRTASSVYSLDIHTVSGAALPGAAANVFKIGDLVVRAGERFVIQGVADIISSSPGLALTNIRLYSGGGGFLQDGQTSVSPGLGRASVPLPALSYVALADDTIQIYAYGNAASGAHVWQSASVTCSLLGVR